MMSLPSKRMLPEVGFFSPEIVRRVVVFPAPFAPIRVTISPSLTVREMPFKAWITPKWTFKSFISSMVYVLPQIGFDDLAVALDLIGRAVGNDHTVVQNIDPFADLHDQ